MILKSLSSPDKEYSSILLSIQIIELASYYYEINLREYLSVKLIQYIVFQLLSEGNKFGEYSGYLSENTPHY